MSEVVDFPIRPGFVIGQEVLDLYRHGLTPGDSTGWRSVDQHYTVAAGQWTLVTGIPGSGKSEWLDAMLVNLASSGWKVCFYSPENHPVPLHVSKLLEKRIGKPFREGPTPRMTKAEVETGLEWLTQRFTWLQPRQRDPMTLLATAIDWLGSDGGKKGVVLDPWNMLEHGRPSNMTETEYISLALSELTHVVREHGFHLWIVAHPAKLERGKDGRRPVPTPYDIAGSAHWYNKADNIIAVHRDQTEDDGKVEVHVQKVRFKHIGKVGYCELHWDKVTGRYLERDVEGRGWLQQVNE